MNIPNLQLLSPLATSNPTVGQSFTEIH